MSLKDRWRDPYWRFIYIIQSVILAVWLVYYCCYIYCDDTMPQVVADICSAFVTICIISLTIYVYICKRNDVKVDWYRVISCAILAILLLLEM